MKEPDLFTDDFEASAALSDTIAIVTGHMYTVVFYRDGKTLGLLKDRAVPGFLAWFDGEMNEGRWKADDVQGESPWQFYDRVGVPA